MNMTERARRRILVLTPRFPYPITAGDTLRIHHICRELSRSFSLTLASICSSKQALAEEPIEPIFDRIERVYHPTWRSALNTAGALFSHKPLQLAYYHSSAFAKLVDDLIPQHDLVFAHLLRTGQYVSTRNGIPTVLEMTDALSLNYQRVAELRGLSLKHVLYRLEMSRISQKEKESVRQFDLVSLVSPTDRDFLLQDLACTEEHVRVYTNGVDLHSRPFIGPGTDPTIAFIGNMRTVHNRDSCLYFVREVLPLVRREIPDIRLRIIGAASPRARRKLESLRGVEVAGWVDSIAEAVRGSFCGIGFVRVGAGVQNKILEYMALGLPVLANGVGIEGLNVQKGKHVLVGNAPRELAEHVILLYQDHRLRDMLARNARAFVEEYHSWTKALQPMVEDVRNLVRKVPDITASHG